MKTKFLLVVMLCLSLLLTACGGGAPEAAEAAPAQNTTAEAPVEEEAAEATEATEATVETIPEPTIAPFLDEGKVLLDNEYITITLQGEVEESYYLGYELVLENKSDEYILVSTENTSVDGYMMYLNLQNSSVSPGKKAKAELQIYNSEEGAMVKTLADLKNVEGGFRLSFNSDGGNTYSSGDEVYPFAIEGRQGEPLPAPETTGQVLVDDDMLRITLMDTFDEEYAVGYKMLVENLSDEYLLVGMDNTSVDGFMVYLHLQNATVAPGKTSVAELTAYTGNGDVESLDELINIEGTFTISTNSDGANLYHSTDITYPLEIAGPAN